MSKTLIIAEKPSVAGDIAKALGGFKRTDFGWERNDVVISNAIGHLVGIAAPANAPKGIPCIPDAFELLPIERTKAQLKTVVSQIKRADVTTIVNACDAGREGELIFRRIEQYAGSKKTVKRMWLQSMTPTSIKQAWENMRSDAQMRSLSDAAFARAEADWIVGINGSRVLKRIAGESSPVGRVMTPTMMLIVDRELAIRNFVSKPFWELHATIGLKSGEFVAKWNSGKPGTPENPSDRFWQEALAKQILEQCKKVDPSSIIDVSSVSKSAAPALFDLTTLQREANRLFGLSAADTLAVAQALYEKHKVLTYPRTDAKALPEDYVSTVKNTVAALSGQGYSEAAQPVLDGGWIKPTKKIFDNSKISDHFAIIPNGSPAGALSPIEQKIYDLVVRRLLAVFYPDAQYAVTERTVSISGHTFIARGKVLKVKGWLAVYQAEQGDDKDSPSMPILLESETGENRGVELHQGKTKPPSRYTEATLLSAMENAGKEVSDDDFKAAMSGRGLGTPATRSATIEKLVEDIYIERDKKTLLPTDKAFKVRELLLQIGATELMSPDLTGEWEFKLGQVEKSKLPKASFMEVITQFTNNLVEKSLKVAPTDHQATSGPVVTCPDCGKSMRRIKRPKGHFWGCTGFSEGCKSSLPDIDGKPGVKRTAQVGFVTNESNGLAIPCPVCHEGKLRLRTGAKGAFWGCSAYPNCKHTQPDDNGKPGIKPTMVAGNTPPSQKAHKAPSAPTANVGDECPTCGKGHLQAKNMKDSGKPFIGCDQFPACRHFAWPSRIHS